MWAWIVGCAGSTPGPTPNSVSSNTAVEVSALGPPAWGLGDVAVSDDAVWVAWVADDLDVPNGRDVLVTRSTDGQAFELPVAVGPDLEPSAVWPRIPRLSIAADGGVLLAFTAVRPGTESVVVFRAPPGSTAFDLVFERERTVADDAVEVLLPVARSGPTGSTWVAWVLARGATAELWVAREELGWEESRVDQGDVEPACTCCPVDFAVNGDRAMFLWRGGSRRELLVAEPDGTPTEITSFGLVFLVCPLDGPVIAAAGDGFEVIASDADPSGAGLWSIAEEAPGLWGPPMPIPANADAGGEVPSVAGDRLVYDSVDGPRLATREDGRWGEGVLWVEMADAAEPVRLASGPLGHYSVRVDGDRAVWVAP